MAASSRSLHAISFWSLLLSFLCCQESALALRLLGGMRRFLMPAYFMLSEKSCTLSSEGDKLTLHKAVINWLCRQEKGRRRSVVRAAESIAGMVSPW